MRESWVWKVPVDQIVKAAEKKKHRLEVALAEERAREDERQKAYEKLSPKERGLATYPGLYSPGMSFGPTISDLGRWIKLLGSFPGAVYALDKADMNYFEMPTEPTCDAHSCSCGMSHQAGPA